VFKPSGTTPSAGAGPLTPQQAVRKFWEEQEQKWGERWYLESMKLDQMRAGAATETQLKAQQAISDTAFTTLLYFRNKLQELDSAGIGTTVEQPKLPTTEVFRSPASRIDDVSRSDADVFKGPGTKVERTTKIESQLKAGKAAKKAKGGKDAAVVRRDDTSSSGTDGKEILETGLAIGLGIAGARHERHMDRHHMDKGSGSTKMMKGQNMKMDKTMTTRGPMTTPAKTMTGGKTTTGRTTTGRTTTGGGAAGTVIDTQVGRPVISMPGGLGF
jgi:hypothetical protein